jgi:hypothetical protein
VRARDTYFDSILGRRHRVICNVWRRLAYIIAKGEIDHMHAVWSHLHAVRYDGLLGNEGTPAGLASSPHPANNHRGVSGKKHGHSLSNRRRERGDGQRETIMC